MLASEWSESIIGLAALLIDWVSDCCLMQKKLYDDYNKLQFNEVMF
jgi:hypothetical protein